jgi:hypothetical protein
MHAELSPAITNTYGALANEADLPDLPCHETSGLIESDQKRGPCMNRNFAAGLLVLAACSGSNVPTNGSASAQSAFAIASLTPSSGSIGTNVVIHGSGFTPDGNTVSFAARESGQMPGEPSVIPNLASADGRTITFTVLSVWRPACSYSPPGPCPFANIPTAPGTYAVSVTNSNGTSNAVNFVVAR